MKVFIDAGHNYSGTDTGAYANGMREQDITFKIAEKLAELLKKSGFTVGMSREKNTDILGRTVTESLNMRCKKANSQKADLFISLHCNSCANSAANGTETYVYSKSGKAAALAKALNNRICAKLGTANRGVKTAGFAVLKNTVMPAVLVETAFISNKSDSEKLKNRPDEFADAICSAICGYYGIKNRTEGEADLNDSVKIAAKEQKTPAKYRTEGITHIIEIEPKNIWAVETQKATNQTPYNNFVNSVFFMAQADGTVYPQGIMVNGGKVLCNNPTHGKPVSTLIVHGANDVELKKVTDITKEENVWFAVSGYGIYPYITAEHEGFTGKFSDVTRATNRPIIGYRKWDNKIVIAVRANSNAQRAHETAKNLGLDFAISLDGGGSTTLKVNGTYKFKGDGRKLFGGIIWM